VSDFIKCPICSCLFLTKHDLDLHLKAFGTKANSHLILLSKGHNSLECSLFREQGGADRIVQELADIVLRSKRNSGRGVIDF
jgi:hypothetical protein